MKLPALYGLSSSGKIKMWQATVLECDQIAMIVIEHGFEDGKKQKDTRYIESGKNIGRSNETTPLEQAIFEANSMHKKKQDEGYVEDISLIKAYSDAELWLPMLAKTWDDSKHYAKYPALNQPKLDGCLDGDTLIEFEGGRIIPIKEVVDNKIAGKIKSYDINSCEIEYMEILNHMKNIDDVNEPKTEWFEITLEDERKIKLTGNHRVWIPKLLCYRRVDELDGFEEFLIENMQLVKVKSIKKVESTDKYDLEIHKNHNFFANGILVHNCRFLVEKKNGVTRAWSRQGKEIKTVTKIISQLDKILIDGQKVDGECYVHGWTFQRIISAVKKKCEDTDLLEYHIYDFPDKNKTFKERFVDADKSKFTGNLVIVETVKVENQEDVDAFEEKCINNGYEGCMFRNADGLYKYKHRSSDLLKIKRFQDDEFEIIGGKEGTGRESGAVTFKCITKEGREFEARPTGSIEERRDMWSNINDYIGKKLTVKYQGLTDEGSPRFPVGLHIREDWD